MFTLVPDFDAVDYEVMLPVMDSIREIEEKLQSQYPDLVIGYTGDIPLQADEQIAMSFTCWCPRLSRCC
jgi:predicted RNA-binding protein Jag